MNTLSVLAVDDEPPALDELAYLLRADPRVERVRTAGDALTALKLLDTEPIDAVFLDIRMPGLSGLELAKVLSRFTEPPAIVFVTAYEGAAVEAFELRAVDYLLKPVRAGRLADALGRLVRTTVPGPPDSGEAESGVDKDAIPVELGGVTRFVDIAEVRYVEAHGDYARLHTSSGSHLVRVAMATLEQRWSTRGFVRVHRSYLVSTAHLSELRVEPGGGHAVRLGTGPQAVTLPVSRRHSRELKDRLVRRARGGSP